MPSSNARRKPSHLSESAVAVRGKRRVPDRTRDGRDAGSRPRAARTRAMHWSEQFLEADRPCDKTRHSGPWPKPLRRGCKVAVRFDRELHLVRSSQIRFVVRSSSYSSIFGFTKLTKFFTSCSKPSYASYCNPPMRNACVVSRAPQYFSKIFRISSRSRKV